MSSMKRYIRKDNRLHKSVYENLNIYYLTICCDNRLSAFNDKLLFDFCLSVLKKLAIEYKAKLWAYCFMPDHVHIVIETRNCSKLVHDFKQKTGYHFMKKTGKKLWQKSYYDHVIRSSTGLNASIAYVLDNPVRTRLVNNYKKYPYSGSTEINISEFVES